MGQGFAHERLPEKGTVLLLDTYDLTEILKECQSYASVGYKIASSQHENLKTTLSNAASRINETLIDFNSSPCYVSSATDLLSQQLIDIESAFNNLSFAFKEDLENLRENLSKFSVTFIDIITNPMLVSMENLLNQSLLNSAQGRIVLSKKRQLAVWKDGFKATGKNRIRSLLINLKSQLNGEIAAFAEEHFDDKNADKAWNRLLQEKGIQDNCQTLLTELEETCNDKIKEVSREISQELLFSASFSGDRTLRMNRIIDGKKLWDWSATIIGGGLSISAIFAGAFGAAAAGPLGWIALGVSAVGVLGSLIFKSRDKKEQEARMRLESSLRNECKCPSRSY